MFQRKGDAERGSGSDMSDSERDRLLTREDAVNSQAKPSPSRCRSLWLVIVLFLLIVSYMAAEEFMMMFPEVSFILQPQCKNPGRAWNGQLWGYQVYRNGFEERFKEDKYNSATNPEGDRRKLLQNHNHNSRYEQSSRHLRFPRMLLEAKLSKQPLVVFGTHHKSGTFLAKNLFGSLCKINRWCCIFHVTRDAFPALENTIEEEPNLRVLGHAQWVWHPAELGVPYKFIHFYRDPYAKIISGYNYHALASEPWTKRALPYNKTCILSPGKVKSVKKALESRDVIEFCTGVQLCTPCCRREHEASAANDGKVYLPEHHVSGENRRQHTGKGKREFDYRNGAEYDYLCRHLGSVNTSITDAYNTLSVEKGLRAEAGLQYYENLRMVRIVNSTRHDKGTLNIDIDKITNNLEDGYRKILHHIDPMMSQSTADSLVEEAKRFDIKSSSSYTYQIGLNSLFSNHISTSTKADKETVKSLLRNDAEIEALYNPLYDLLK